MQLQITKTIVQTLPTLGRYFYLEATCGAHEAVITIAPDYVGVLVVNAMSCARRSLGKQYPTLEEALAKYRTPEIRHMIKVAHYESRVTKLEEQGLARSDAQGVADAEDMMAGRAS